MKALKIMAAHTNVALGLVGGTGMTNAAALLTPDPREVASIPATESIQGIDLGEPKVIDTLYFGDNTLPADAYVFVYVGNDPTFASSTFAYGGFIGSNDFSATPASANPRKRHNAISIAPVVGRYVLLDVHNTVAATLGVFATGNSFTARWGTEYGAGRPLLDTSTVDRLISGSFAIDPGAIVGGYQWTFGDLQPSEVVALYRLMASVGQSRSVLVIEDPDFVYDAFTANGAVAGSGSGKILTKTGASGSFNAAAWSPARTDGEAISFKIPVAANQIIFGFTSTPSQQATTGDLDYAYYQTGSAVYRYTDIGGVGGIALGRAVTAGDRISLSYNERQFIMRQNGVVIDAVATQADRSYGSKVVFYENGASVQEANAYALGYEDRIHWGLLSKLEPYERLDPKNTKWGLSVLDWA